VVGVGEGVGVAVVVVAAGAAVDVVGTDVGATGVVEVDVVGVADGVAVAVGDDVGSATCPGKGAATAAVGVSDTTSKQPAARLEARTANRRAARLRSDERTDAYLPGTSKTGRADQARSTCSRAD
jgi:hypothetical protein